MSPASHCLPSGTLAAGELPVPSFPGGATLNRPAGGNRGIVVIIPGMDTHPIGYGYDTSTLPPPLANSAGYPGGFFPVGTLDFSTQLNTDHWSTIYPTTLGLNYSGGSQLTAWSNLLANDAAQGALALNAVLRWWDHVVWWVQSTLGPTWPIVPFGASLGGWHALMIANYKTKTIAAYGAHVPAVRLWATSPAFVGGLQGPAAFSTTVSAGSNGATFALSNYTLQVASTTGFATASTSNPQSLTLSSGGWNSVTYTGTQASPVAFTGVNGGLGATAVATGDSVTQNTYTSGCDVPVNGLASLGNGQQGSVPVGYVGWETGDYFSSWATAKAVYDTAHAASAPVTSYARSGGTHAFDSTDVTAAINWFSATVDPLCPATH
jgi:hypothetical protein